MKPCNDYNYKLMQRGVMHVEAAPAPKDLVHHQSVAHAQVNLPASTPPAPVEPVPVVVVSNQQEVAPRGLESPMTTGYMSVEPQPVPQVTAEKPVVPAPAPVPGPMTIDELIDMTQPNRPRITLETKKKS